MRAAPASRPPCPPPDQQSAAQSRSISQGPKAGLISLGFVVYMLCAALGITPMTRYGLLWLAWQAVRPEWTLALPTTAGWR